MVERINKLCDKWGISLKSLEKLLELGNGTIRRWDENSPSVNKVKKVAEFFGVTVSYLIGEETEKAHPLDESELDNELIKLLVGLTPSELLQVSAYVAGLKANREA